VIENYFFTRRDVREQKKHNSIFLLRVLFVQEKLEINKMQQPSNRVMGITVLVILFAWYSVRNSKYITVVTFVLTLE
jgi:hypothetical protein